ncbi:MAG: right-handed parallel beta-helix repeat-containing protein [Propionibacterium sp.]|nr:right-handed parallel beta-helix repeat-containing protein [Propionibacterium sp.]
MVRFCDVCTTNADPSVEGMAAYPEQVFVDGQPLTQVATRDEVTSSSFFVDDPDPVTLKEPGNSRGGYNVKPHTGTSYVIGVNPAEHTVEVVQHSRALTITAAGAALKGVTVEKYSPVQEWDYNDPEIKLFTGGAMVFAWANDLVIENSTFRYSSAASALGVANSQNSTVSGNVFENNGAGGFGIDKSSNIAVEHNRWTSNNTSGFITTACGAYCTLGDTKITHAEGIRFAHNIVDYSNLDKDASLPENYSTDHRIGVWFDEGVINSQIVDNYFVNVPVAIFNEVSSKNMIASNIVEGAGVGIHVSGSDDTQIWNNTISHALTSIFIQQDDRSKGCNERYEDGSCTRPQPWSVEHGLSWDTTGTAIYNNILSSEQTTAKDGDPWAFSMMMKVTGAQNTDGSGAVYANEMVTGIDHNAYYRAPAQANVPSTTVLWNWGPNKPGDSVNAETLADFTNNEHVTAAGREANGLDLRGSREENPLFVKEAADPTAWKTSDFHPKPGGPAVGSGQPLPDDVAKAIGVEAGKPVDRGALVNAAWQA